MNEREQPEPDQPDCPDEAGTQDIPEHMKPENLEKLRDYGKDMIPPGVARPLQAGDEVPNPLRRLDAVGKRRHQRHAYPSGARIETFHFP